MFVLLLRETPAHDCGIDASTVITAIAWRFVSADTEEPLSRVCVRLFFILFVALYNLCYLVLFLSATLPATGLLQRLAASFQTPDGRRLTPDDCRVSDACCVTHTRVASAVWGAAGGGGAPIKDIWPGFERARRGVPNGQK